ncbi:UTP-glucose-1-phosphate uridylyltransferase [Actinobacillus equuli]|nr:UTP-glucose-1-phosphate uridylyltransferase [Actinobacillus equuli]
MIKRFNETKHSQIMVAPVPKEDVSSYGVADCAGVEIPAGTTAKL